MARGSTSILTLLLTTLAVTCVIVGAVAAESYKNPEGDVTVERLPMPTDPTLLKGREVWSGTCQGCHGSGAAGSPKITHVDLWAPRISKGMETLYQHALEGFFGPKFTEMPPRGGNPELTDDEVKAAVAFMVHNSQ